MKKALFLALVAGMLSLSAAQIHWEKDFPAAVAKAKKLHRPIFFVVSRHTCRWCVHLERTTFRDPKVIDTLNRDFVNVVAYTDERDFIPRDLYTPGTPTLWFLDEGGDPLFQPIPGAIGAEDMVRAARIVEEEYGKR